MGSFIYFLSLSEIYMQWLYNHNQQSAAYPLTICYSQCILSLRLPMYLTSITSLFQHKHILKRRLFRYSKAPCSIHVPHRDVKTGNVWFASHCLTKITQDFQDFMSSCTCYLDLLNNEHMLSRATSSV